MDLVPPLRYGMVEEGLFRGAYPLLRNFNFLRRLGLKTIVSLTPEEPTKDLKSFCKSEGITNVWIEADRFKGEPQLLHSDLSTVLATLLNAECYPIYLHCLDGRQTTGMCVMALRKVMYWGYQPIHDEFLRYAKEAGSELAFIVDFPADLQAPARLPRWLWPSAECGVTPSYKLPQFSDEELYRQLAPGPPSPTLSRAQMDGPSLSSVDSSSGKTQQRGGLYSAVTPSGLFAQVRSEYYPPPLDLLITDQATRARKHQLLRLSFPHQSRTQHLPLHRPQPQQQQQSQQQQRRADGTAANSPSPASGAPSPAAGDSGPPSFRNADGSVVIIGGGTPIDERGTLAKGGAAAVGPQASAAAPSAAGGSAAGSSASRVGAAGKRMTPNRSSEGLDQQSGGSGGAVGGGGGGPLSSSRRGGSAGATNTAAALSGDTTTQMGGVGGGQQLTGVAAALFAHLNSGAQTTAQPNATLQRGGGGGGKTARGGSSNPSTANSTAAATASASAAAAAAGAPLVARYYINVKGMKPIAFRHDEADCDAAKALNRAAAAYERSLDIATQGNASYDKQLMLASVAPPPPPPTFLSSSPSAPSASGAGATANSGAAAWGSSQRGAYGKKRQPVATIGTANTAVLFVPNSGGVEGREGGETSPLPAAHSFANETPNAAGGEGGGVGMSAAVSFRAAYGDASARSGAGTFSSDDYFFADGGGGGAGGVTGGGNGEGPVPFGGAGEGMAGSADGFVSDLGGSYNATHRSEESPLPVTATAAVAVANAASNPTARIDESKAVTAGLRIHIRRSAENTSAEDLGATVGGGAGAGSVLATSYLSNGGGTTADDGSVGATPLVLRDIADGSAVAEALGGGTSVGAVGSRLFAPPNEDVGGDATLTPTPPIAKNANKAGAGGAEELPPLTAADRVGSSTLRRGRSAVAASGTGGGKDGSGALLTNIAPPVSGPSVDDFLSAAPGAAMRSMLPLEDNPLLTGGTGGTASAATTAGSDSQLQPSATSAAALFKAHQAAVLLAGSSSGGQQPLPSSRVGGTSSSSASSVTAPAPTIAINSNNFKTVAQSANAYNNKSACCDHLATWRALGAPESIFYLSLRTTMLFPEALAASMKHAAERDGIGGRGFGSEAIAEIRKSAALPSAEKTVAQSPSVATVAGGSGNSSGTTPPLFNSGATGVHGIGADLRSGPATPTSMGAAGGGGKESARLGGKGAANAKGQSGGGSKSIAPPKSGAVGSQPTTARGSGGAGAPISHGGFGSFAFPSGQGGITSNTNGPTNANKGNNGETRPSIISSSVIGAEDSWCSGHGKTLGRGAVSAEVTSGPTYNPFAVPAHLHQRQPRAVPMFCHFRHAPSAARCYRGDEEKLGAFQRSASR